MLDYDRPVEVLIALTESGPEVWHPGRILKMVHLEGTFGCPEWRLVQVEIQVKDGQSIEVIINDGPYQARRRIRQQTEDRAVTPETFNKTGYSWPLEISSYDLDSDSDFYYCLDNKISDALFCKSFPFVWLQRSTTLFVSARDDWFINLHRGAAVEMDGWHVRNDEYFDTSEHGYSRFEYVEWFREELLNGRNGIVYDTMQDVIECVIFMEENAFEDNIMFKDIHQDLQLLVLSHLDAYDRAILQRVSRRWKGLLSSTFVRRDLIINHLPSKWSLSDGARRFLPTRHSVPDIISILCHSITKTTRTIYLVGDWCISRRRPRFPYLHPLTACLHFLSIKLDWIVLADRSHFTPQEFIQFQTMGKLINQLPQIIPDFATVCEKLAIKNSRFVLCGRKFFPNNLTRSYSSSFEVFIARWSFCFTRTTSETFSLSLINMLERCCPHLDRSNVELIHERIDQLPGTTHMSFREDSFDAALWFTLVFAMERWNLKAPKNVNEVQRFLKEENNGKSKKLLLQTLNFWRNLEPPETLPYIG